MGNKNKDLFEEKLNGIDSEEERKTIKDIRDMLTTLVKKSRGEIVYGDGLERPAFFAKWTKYGNQTKATIEYDTKKGFELWFLYKDLEEKRPTLRDKLVNCLETHFPSRNKENISIYQTKNPCLPISECIGKVDLLEECLKLLNEGR